MTDYSSRTSYITHFNCKMEETDKRKLSPWMFERCLTQHLGSKPKIIRSRSRTTFSVEVSDVKQSKKIRGLTHLNNLPVAVDKETPTSRSRIME